MIIAEAEVLLRPVAGPQFATQLDQQVTGAVTKTKKLDTALQGVGNTAVTTGKKIEGAGVSASGTGKKLEAVGGSGKKLESSLIGVAKQGTVSGTVLSKLGLQSSILGQALSGALPTAATIGAAAIAVFAFKGIKSFLTLADSVRQFQIVSGASAVDASKLIAVTSALGVSSQSAGTGVFFLEKNLEHATPKLAALGVTIAKTNTGALDVTSTLLNVADAVTATEDPAKKALIAFDAFGRGGKALLPVLEQGRAGIKALIDEAQKSGQIISQQQVDQAFKFQSQLHHLGEEAGKFGRSLGSVVVPALAALAEGLSQDLDWLGKFGSEIGKIFRDPGAFLGDVGRFLNPFPPAAKKAADGATELHGKVIAVNQEMDTLAHTSVLTSDQITKLGNDLAAAGFSADQSAQLIDSVTTASANLAVQATKTVAQVNRLGIGITREFGLTKHQVLDWQRTLSTSLNFVEGDLQTLGGQSKLSAADVVKSFDQQLRAMATYKDNFDKILARNAPADLVKQLADMGDKGATLVAALANANQTQFDRIVHDWTLAEHRSTAVGKDIRADFLKEGPIKIPVVVAFDKKLGLVNARAAKQDLLDQLGSIKTPIAATASVATQTMNVTAASVSILNKKGLMAGGFLNPGEVALTGERGPELQVGGPQGTTIIPNNRLGFSSQDVNRIILAIERAIAAARPIMVNEVAQNPVATAESVAARLGAQAVR